MQEAAPSPGSVVLFVGVSVFQSRTVTYVVLAHGSGQMRFGPLKQILHKKAQP